MKYIIVCSIILILSTVIEITSMFLKRTENQGFFWIVGCILCLFIGMGYAEALGITNFF